MEVLCLHKEPSGDEWFSELLQSDHDKVIALLRNNRQARNYKTIMGDLPRELDSIPYQSAPDPLITPLFAVETYESIEEAAKEVWATALWDYTDTCRKFIDKHAPMGAYGNTTRYTTCTNVKDIGVVEFEYTFNIIEVYNKALPRAVSMVGNYTIPETEVRHRVYGYLGDRSNFHTAIVFVDGHTEWCTYQFWNECESDLLPKETVEVAHYVKDSLLDDIQYWELEHEVLANDGYIMTKPALHSLMTEAIEIISQSNLYTEKLVDSKGVLMISPPDLLGGMSIVKERNLSPYYDLTGVMQQTITMLCIRDVLDRSSLNLYHQSNRIASQLLRAATLPNGPMFNKV